MIAWRTQARRALATGPRVFLRHPVGADREAFLAFVAASQTLHHPWVDPPRDGRSFDRYVRRAVSENHCGMLVCLREDGEIAGVVNLNEIVRGSLQSAFVGFYVAAAHGGMGYMREGLCLALGHAFRGLRLHRVEANVQPDNERSLGLVRRCGFRREGFSTRYLKVGGRWRDHERWAVLAEEWHPGPGPRAARIKRRTRSR